MHPIEYSTGDGAGKRGTRNGPQARQHHPRPLRRTTSPVYLRRVRFKWPGMDGMLPAMLKSVHRDYSFIGLLRSREYPLHTSAYSPSPCV